MCLRSLEFEDAGFERERKDTNDGVDDVECHCRVRVRHPWKSCVERCDDYHEYFHGTDVPFCAIEDGRDDQGRANADEEEKGDGVGTLLLRIAVRYESLNGDGKSGLDSAGEHAESDKLEVKCWILGQGFEAVFHVEAVSRGDVGWWCRRVVGKEENRYGDDGENYGDYEVLDVIVCEGMLVKRTCLRDLVVW